ncbi:hypothetical protein Pelo_11412 [Pelomyxa schiedti]|nr:hypothetical protein Pelo_11412 [Pelomyxa schiedti]
MLYTVKGCLGAQIKTIDVEQGTPFSEVKRMLETKFHVPLTVSWRNSAVYQDQQYDIVLKDAISHKAKFITLDLVAPTMGSHVPVKPEVVSSPTPKPSPTHQPLVRKDTGSFVFCSNCGNKLPATAKFCGGCGNRM